MERRGGVYGSTPLHVAAWLGRTEVVRELLGKGASASEVNDEGKPGLVWAVLYGYKEIERLLRGEGAELEEWLWVQVQEEIGRAGGGEGEEL